MTERIEVFVNDKAVTVYRGMKVKHALIAYNATAYEECRMEGLTVRDGDGFLVGLEGALHQNVRLFVTGKR